MTVISATDAVFPRAAIAGSVRPSPVARTIGLERIVLEDLDVAVGRTRTVDTDPFHGGAEHFFA